jgi:hypothetical protein
MGRDRAQPLGLAGVATELIDAVDEERTRQRLTGTFTRKHRRAGAGRRVTRGGRTPMSRPFVACRGYLRTRNDWILPPSSVPETAATTTPRLLRTVIENVSRSRPGSPASMALASNV